MNAAARYLQNAEECIAISRRVTGADQETLLRIGAAWRELAEQELKPKTSSDGGVLPTE